MQRLGIKGLHIAERDTQKSLIKKVPNYFLNTWSVEGLIFESTQPAELGWGTHEKSLPAGGQTHNYGCKSAIYINKPAATTKVRTWTPETGAHYGYLITHNEAISISDYFTIKNVDEVIYRPTCHYAYRPTDVTIESLEELFEKKHGKPQDNLHVLNEDEIQGGKDELGVLLYGHAKNAYWFGSQLSIEEARRLAPYQNATGLQVSSAVLTGLLWAIKHPEEGLVEVDEIDFEECLEIQKTYLGTLQGYYTDWNPLSGELGIATNADHEDPWQFKNILIE
jgi:homospermidine synthase